MVKPLLLHISMATSLSVYVQIVGQKSLKKILAQNPRTKCPVLGCKLGRIRPENGMPQNALMKCLQKKRGSRHCFFEHCFQNE